MKFKDTARIRESNPRKEILNEELIGQPLWDCLKNGDEEGIIEVLRIYREASEVDSPRQLLRIP